MKTIISRLAPATGLAAGVILPAQVLYNQIKIDLQTTLLPFAQSASNDAGHLVVIGRSS